jgi:uncharacterized protein YbjT (DUF2867 family)
MYLIAGARGMLGGAIAARLLDRGHAVRALTRTPDALQALADRGAEVVRGDLRDVDSLRDACRGATRVITTANAFMGRGAESPDRVDGEGNRNLIDAAREAGVEHFVFTSGRVPAAIQAVDFFRCKVETEAYLRASGVPYTIVRPTAFMEVWGQMLVDPAATAGRATIFGSGTMPMNMVAVADVADAMVGIAEGAPRMGAVEIGGPDNLTPLEVVALTGRVTGRTVKHSRVPRGVIRVMSIVAGPFNPVLARQMRSGLAMDGEDSSFDAASAGDGAVAAPTRLEDWIRERHGIPA